MRRLCRESTVPTALSDSGTGAPPRDIVALRRELAQAERWLRERAEREAKRLAEAEREAWREARDACFLFDRIQQNVTSRLNAIEAGGQERFLGERRLAELGLLDADRANASYTVLSFARLRDRLRFLRGGLEREAIVREALKRGGVYTARGYFQEILK
jgi:hypothetical protein